MWSDVLRHYGREVARTYHLNTCPFCKSKAELVAVKRPLFPLRRWFKHRRIKLFITVRCTKCGASTRPYICVEDAVEHWNVRRDIHE